MNIIINPAVMYPILAVISLILLYGLYLAIRLFMRAEWQWLCLSFIALPTILFYAVVLKIKLDNPYLSHPPSNAALWGFLYLLFVSLSSGFGVYRLMNKYHQQTIFINCYAFFYFANAFALIGCLFCIATITITGLLFFLGLLKLLPLYGIVVLISGVGVMDYRLRQLKAEDKE